MGDHTEKQILRMCNQPVNSKALIAAFPAHNKGTSKSGLLPPIKLPINDTNNDCDHFKLFLSILGL